MKTFIKVALASLLILGTVGGGLWLLTDPNFGKSVSGSRISRQEPPRAAARTDPQIPFFSDQFIDDSGYDLAFSYSGQISDRSDLKLCISAAIGRTERGVSNVKTLLEGIENARPRPVDFQKRRAMLHMFIGLLYMYDGDFDEASRWIDKAIAENPEIARELHANFVALRGVAALRQGELDNCVACLGASSCIFPLDRQAVHQQPTGSREAIKHFTAYLDERPDDLGVRWLLNIAYMTLGEYPEKVPAKQRIPLSAFASKIDIGRFINIAPTAGFGTRPANMLGGSIFDDFNGDGRPDVLIVSGDWDLGGALYLNKGDGGFEEKKDAGLDSEMLAVNATHADIDNDGDLDILLLRGGWETPYRMSLLRNQGNGKFDDVTISAGLSEPIATQTAAWGDYDNDGFIDVYIGGEYHDRNASPENRGRLYHNLGNFTFENVSMTAGVENERWAKGVVWGDYDNDGKLDLYVSNMNGENRLYHNLGEGRFEDVAPTLGLTEPIRSFSCWFWDYDNDGKLDLFVTGFGCSLYDIISDQLGMTSKGERPRLYRNLGSAGFKDVTAEVGLNRVWIPMGSNFADIDNDGFLDFYLATGRPPYSVLVPNILMKNVQGQRFEDITESSGTGHLQKGHGVSFADGDGDGSLDLFVEIGGQTPGDKAHNVYFKNPGQGNHWLKLKLIGTKTNRAAIGARIAAEIAGPEGTTRTLHRWINAGSSFGGNSLVATLGLGTAKTIKTLTITWPTSDTTQVFHDITGDRAIEITEGSEYLKSLNR